MGRPTKLTPEIQAGICEKVRMGLPLRWAAAAHYVGEATIKEWIQRGKGEHERGDPDGTYAEFAAAIEAARAECFGIYLGITAKSARGKHEGDWKAAAWYLSRACPEMRDKAETILTGADGGAVKVEVDDDALLEKLRRLGGADEPGQD